MEFRDSISLTAQQVDNIFASQPFVMHATLATGTLLYPGCLMLLSHGAGRVTHTIFSKGEGKPKSFVEEAYVYMPLCWVALLAHFLDLDTTEAGRVFPVAARTFGFSSLSDSGVLPEIVADHHVVDFVQGICVLVGLVSHFAPIQAKNHWSVLLPQAFSISFLAFQYFKCIVNS